MLEEQELDDQPKMRFGSKLLSFATTQAPSGVPKNRTNSQPSITVTSAAVRGRPSEDKERPSSMPHTPLGPPHSPAQESVLSDYDFTGLDLRVNRNYSTYSELSSYAVNGGTPRDVHNMPPIPSSTRGGRSVKRRDSRAYDAPHGRNRALTDATDTSMSIVNPIFPVEEDVNGEDASDEEFCPSPRNQPIHKDDSNQPLGRPPGDVVKRRDVEPKRVIERDSEVASDEEADNRRSGRTRQKPPVESVHNPSREPGSPGSPEASSRVQPNNQGLSPLQLFESNGRRNIPARRQSDPDEGIWIDMRDIPIELKAQLKGQRAESEPAILSESRWAGEWKRSGKIRATPRTPCVKPKPQPPSPRYQQPPPPTPTSPSALSHARMAFCLVRRRNSGNHNQPTWGGKWMLSWKQRTNPMALNLLQCDQTSWILMHSRWTKLPSSLYWELWRW